MHVRRFGARNLSVAAAAILFGGLLVAGCNERIVTFRDTAIPIPRHATWAWRPMPAAPPAQARNNGGDNRPVTSRDVITEQQRGPVVREPDPATETARLQARKAIEKDMADKGFVHVDDPGAADFLVDYHLAVHVQNVTVARGGYGYPGVVCGPYGCYNSWGWGPPDIHYESIPFREGTFVFDFVKANSGRLAYRANGQEPPRRHELTQDNVNDMIHALLKGLKGH
jgi:hypothetical protein